MEMETNADHKTCRGLPNRRQFLADTGMGFTGLALGSMLLGDDVARGDTAAAWSPPDGRPQFAPKAKSVIWLFMLGGTSHMESFDPKPELNKYAGKTFEESPTTSRFSNRSITAATCGTSPAFHGI